MIVLAGGQPRGGGTELARVGFVVSGLLLMLVAAPTLLLGGFGVGLGAALSGSGVGSSSGVAICCGGLVAGVAGLIMFIAGLVMKSKADLALIRAQTDYLRGYPPPPP